MVDVLSRSRRAAGAPGLEPIGPSHYRELYFDAGFERIEVVEITHECLGGLLSHRRRVLRPDAWVGLIDPPTYGKRAATIEAARMEDGYVLLACAQKAEDPPG
jgi:hypothetical protein